MPEWLAPAITLLCLAGAAGLLVALCVIDLRVRLLPNVLVLPFAVLGIIFHAASNWALLAPFDLLYGAALGGGILYGIRIVANHFYGRDTLGLGDVKLMAAAGLWLGPDGILMALSLGALCGMIHGLGVALWTARRTGQPVTLNRLEIPAGPGFALGIVLMGLYQYGQF